MRRVNAYVCRLDWIISTSKQRWNKDKCRCEFKELIDKGACDKGFIFNPSICECEGDRSRGTGEYLNYWNCKCRKKLVESIIDECAETIEEVKIVNILVENENSYYKWSSCKVYIVFMAVIFIVFTIFTGITIYFVYCNCSLIKNNYSCIQFNTCKETFGKCNI